MLGRVRVVSSREGSVWEKNIAMLFTDMEVVPSKCLKSEKP